MLSRSLSQDRVKKKDKARAGPLGRYLEELFKVGKLRGGTSGR